MRGHGEARRRALGAADVGAVRDRLRGYGTGERAAPGRRAWHGPGGRRSGIGRVERTSGRGRGSGRREGSGQGGGAEAREESHRRRPAARGHPAFTRGDRIVRERVEAHRDRRSGRGRRRGREGLAVARRGRVTVPAQRDRQGGTALGALRRARGARGRTGGRVAPPQLRAGAAVVARVMVRRAMDLRVDGGRRRVHGGRGDEEHGAGRGRPRQQGEGEQSDRACDPAKPRHQPRSSSRVPREPRGSNLPMRTRRDGSHDGTAARGNRQVVHKPRGVRRAVAVGGGPAPRSHERGQNCHAKVRSRV
jgi:hypothetical protein